MNIKTILCVATSALAAIVMASDTPEVSNVLMSQSSTGRKVTITYELSNAANGAVVTLDIETNKTGSATNVDSDWVSIGGAAVCNARGAVWRKVTSADADGSGKYTITWRPDQSWEGHKIELANGGARAVVTAWALDNTPDYMVVDISAAAKPNTQRYYPAVDFLPGGLLGNDDYRTTLLVMRKIMAKDVTWTMGSVEEPKRNASREATHLVTLTNNYYIGAFEITQAQWGVVATNSSQKAFFTTERLMRPMEQVCYAEIRTSNNNNDNSTYRYPAGPNPASFLGLLNSKTGLDFDLPSESQWEFAARAGHGSGYWGDGSAIVTPDYSPDANLDFIGRYKASGGYIDGATEPTASCEVTNGTAVVGSYKPNSWGLYDMHGNVWEWCLDGFASDISALNGRVNPSGSPVVRGGGWDSAALECRAALRSYNTVGYRIKNYGFRVACTAGLE